MELDKLKRIIELMFPNDYEIEYSVGEEGDENNITISVPTEHIAIIIGRAGRNAKAIRELIFLYNKLHDTSYSVEIVER